MGGDFLEGWAIGTAIAYRAPTQTAPAVSSNYGESLHRMGELVVKSQQETRDFRRYAGRLRVNLEARKMSESVLLKALKEENINHPLATEAGFEALFQKMIADQYGIIDSPENKYIAKDGSTQYKSGDKVIANKDAMLRAEGISTEAGRMVVG